VGTDLAKRLGGVALAVLLLFWVFRGVDGTDLLAALGRASLFWLVVSGSLQIGHNLFRVLRWRCLLAPVRERVPLRPMFTSVILGYMTTWIVPGRIGEIVRPALLSAREGIPIGPSMGSVLGDRLADAAAILMLLLAGLWITPLEAEAAAFAEAVRASSIAVAVVLAVLLAGLLLLGVVRPAFARIEERRGFSGWLARTAISVAEGTAALRRPALAAPILGYSLAAWLVIALGTWAGVRSAGVDVPFGGVLIMQPVLAIGIALPTPGGAGGFHAAMKACLVYLFGVPETAAVSAAILTHLASVVPVLVVGAVLLRTERLSWGDLLGAARQVRSLGASENAP